MRSGTPPHEEGIFAQTATLCAKSQTKVHSSTLSCKDHAKSCRYQIMSPEESEERFPKNAAGPFFVVNGGCITCMAPEHEAPDLMGFDQEQHHCYFKKQPVTP